MSLRAIRARLAALLVALALLLGWSAAARAQGCEFSMTDIDFGAVDVLSSASTDVSGLLTIDCSYLLGIGLLGSISGDISIGSGEAGADSSSRYMDSLTTASTLSYQLYKDASRTSIVGSTYGSYGGTPISLSTFSAILLGTGTTTVPIYGRVFGNQTSTVPGSYASLFDRDIIDVRVDYRTCNLLLLCVSRTATFSFEVRATVLPECLVTANDLNFGSVSLLTSNIDAQSSLEVRCTAGTGFDINLDNGLYGSGPTSRIMRNPGGEGVSYGLYRDAARALPWGNTANGMPQPGVGSGTAASFDAYGRVPPQTTPSPGVYSDTIVVTVTY